MASTRRVGVVESPRGLGAGDHACWCYDDDGSYVRDAVLFLADGAAGGDLLCYVGDKSPAALMADLASLPGRDQLLERGQLQIRTAADAFGPSVRFDIRSLLTERRRSLDAAVAAGHRGFRLCADVTALATSDSADRLPAYELAVDRLAGEGPLTVLCGYDERRVANLDVIRAVHPLQADRPGSAGFALYPAAGIASGFHLTGELDAGTADLLAAALRAAAAASAGPLLLDLTDLHFVDAAATRTLARFALELHLADRAVQFRSARPTVAFCLTAFDLGHLLHPSRPW